MLYYIYRVCEVLRYMEEIRCPGCGSSDVYFSKKKQLYVCEDCGNEFYSVSENAEKSVFFSYAHDANESIVLKIKKHFEKNGFSVWIDKSKIKEGDDWRRAITQGILNSYGVVAFLSKHSVRTPGVCLDELRIALSVKHGNIKTVLLEDEKDVSPPASISTIQWLDMSKWKNHVSSEAENNAWFEEKANNLVNLIKNDNFSYFDGEISRIRSVLNVTITDAKEHELSNKRFFGRKWLSEQIEDWRKDRLNPNIFLLYGAPGIGKSAFAVNLMHYNPNVICGILCEWDKENSRNPKILIKTLAVKIASKLQDYRKLLLSVLDANYTEYIKTLSSADLFEQLIIQPLSECIDGGRERHIIIIDGLDETDKNGNNELAEILANNISKLPPWIGFLITCRPESNLKRIFSSIKAYEYCPTNTFNEKDIREFLSNALANDLKRIQNGAKTIDDIVRNCAGNFLYASLFVESVRQGSIDLNKPSDYPNGLDNIYLRSFKRIFPDRDSYLSPRNILEILLSCESIPLTLLNAASDTDLYTLISFKEKMGSLLTERLLYSDRSGKSEKCYAFCHKSIKDWLTDPDRSGQFFVNVKNGYARAADRFAIIIKKPYPENPPLTIEEKNNLYIQDHLTKCWVNAEAWDSLRNFLSQSNTPLYPYWLCLTNFPEDYYLSDLLEILWTKADCPSFFRKLQRLGERTFVFKILEKLRNKYGIEAFPSDLFETYTDIIHLGGKYEEAVAMYARYLQSFSETTIYQNDMLTRYAIRKIHHSMFFSPVKRLINEALLLYNNISTTANNKNMNEILFLLGGNLGLLSGDTDFTEKWLSEAEKFAEVTGDADAKCRITRKKADLLCLKDNYSDAFEQIGKYISLQTEPQTRYEIYLLGALAETYRQALDLIKAEKLYNKLLSITRKKGLPGWECHAHLGLALAVSAQDDCDSALCLEHLGKAQYAYSKFNHAWGKINSEIVKSEIYRNCNIRNGNIYSNLVNAEKLAKKLQYNYETKILKKLIKGETINNYRLLFL